MNNRKIQDLDSTLNEPKILESWNEKLRPPLPIPPPPPQFQWWKNGAFCFARAWFIIDLGGVEGGETNGLSSTRLL